MTPATDVSLPMVFVNGEPAAADARAISARDRGFTLADGLFETMRVRRGVVFRLDQHLTRLANGLRALAIAEPTDLRRWVLEAVAVTARADVSLRLTVTRGPGAGGLAPPVTGQPTIVITVGAMPTVDPAIYATGLRAVVASGRRNPHAMTAGLKTLSYTDSVLAWLEAQRVGADEALFLDTDGHCSEATASNLFIYRSGTLSTPPTSCAALPGITRAAVLELARSLEIAIEERPFGPEQLTAADEAFLTSSLRGIAPLTALDRRAVGSGQVGEVTRRMSAAYQALVDKECA